MAAGKTFEFLFQLSAKLGPTFSQSFKNASRTMDVLKDDLGSAKQKIEDVSAYQKQQKAVEDSTNRVNKLQIEYNGLTQEIEATDNSVKEQESQLRKVNSALTRAEKSLESSSNKVNELQVQYDRLSQEIGDTNNATKQQKKELEKAEIALTKAKNVVESKSDKVKELQVQYDRLSEEITENKNILQKQEKKFEKVEEALTKAKNTVSEGEAKLRDMSKALKEAGVNTDSLSKNTIELQKQCEKLAETQQKVKEISEKQAKNNATIFKTKAQIVGITGAVVGLAKSFFALDSATEEYRNNQAKLMTAFQSVGLSSNAAKEAYAGFYKVLGDDDTATEASQLLAKLAKSEADVSKWTNIAAGVYGTFGDSLPIEGLIESANETAKTGQITGTFADAINWAAKEGERFGVTLKKNTKANKEWNDAVKKAETAEDYFNLALQACSSEAERNQLIMDTLQSTYQDATTAFQENNKQIIQNRQAQVVWNDILGNTGKIATTVKGMIIDMFGVAEDGSVKANSALSVLQHTLGKLADNPQLVKTIAKTVALFAAVKVGGLTAKLGFLYVKDGIWSVQRAFTLMKGLGITKYLGSITGGFGGVLKSVAPIIGIVTAVGGAIYYVSTHLEQVREVIQKTFGEEGLVIFDKLWAIITQVGTAIKNAFFVGGSGILTTLSTTLPIVTTTLQTKLLPILPKIAELGMLILPFLVQLITTILPVFHQLASAIITVLVSLVVDALPVLIQLISELLPLILQVAQMVLPALVQLISAILPLVIQITEAILPMFLSLLNVIMPIVIQIIQEVLPVLIQLIQSILPLAQFITGTILPLFINLLSNMMPVLQIIIQNILPMVQILLTAIIPIIQFLAEVLTSTLGTALQSIMAIVQNVMQVFQGLIDFITGVFTGNWSKAWTGLTQIFSGIVGGLGELAKAPLRTIVTAVNTVIGGLNKLKVPDWVPGLGGKGINIPLIPGFYKGTNKTPDTFIAGEKGPELITGAAGRKVFTATQTNRIFKNIEKLQTYNIQNTQNKEKTILSKATSTIESIRNNKVSDWIVGLREKGINIPLIPGFYKGTNKTPDTFIAGEKGPELITGAAGQKLFTALQTGQVFNHMAQAKNLNTVNDVNVGTSGSNTIVIHVTNSPNITVNQGDINQIKAQLQQYDQEFLERLREMIQAILKEQREQEVRVTYA